MEEIITNCKTYISNGKFPIRLYVLPESSLTETDISNIIGYASWQDGFNHNTAHKVGGRDVLIARKNALITGIDGIDSYKALQIGGIGYCSPHLNVNQQDDHTIINHKKFNPPSNRNFAAQQKGNSQTSPHVDENGNVSYRRNEYLPWGTYITADLADKVKATHEMTTHHFRLFGVPPVEAYGIYNNENLSHNNQPFGFIVTAYPDIGIKRIDTSIQDKPSLLTVELIRKVIIAAAELHKAGYAHLQTHLGNLHFLEEKERILISDWETLQELNGTPKQNVMWKTLDVLRPIRDYASLKRFLEIPYHQNEIKELIERTLRIYSKAITGKPIDPDMKQIWRSEASINPGVADYILKL